MNCNTFDIGTDNVPTPSTTLSVGDKSSEMNTMKNLCQCQLYYVFLSGIHVVNLNMPLQTTALESMPGISSIP